MPLKLVQDDITTMHVDAIVNAANTSLMMGSGVCGSIFRAAGIGAMQDACAALAPVATGNAVITPGFDLPARYVIHTPGPVWCGGTRGEESQLRSCYRHCLELAVENGCTSIAFPLISAGIYGYPVGEAVDVAINEITTFLSGNDMTVYLTLLDDYAYGIASELVE